MITLDDYMGVWHEHPDATDEVKGNAIDLLHRVNDLLDQAFMDGVDPHLNPVTKSYVAGKTYGGFRPQDCPQGAPNSSHKQGKAVDIYDPNNELDKWCFTHQSDLQRFGLYMEHPDSTNKWCHLTTRAPGSGKICFLP